MDATVILKIASRKKSKAEILQALEILCNPRYSLREAERVYQSFEHNKYNTNFHRRFTACRIK